jgi:hypothetical protein
MARCCICLIPIIHTYFIIKTFYCDVSFERGDGGNWGRVQGSSSETFTGKNWH